MLYKLNFICTFIIKISIHFQTLHKDLYRLLTTFHKIQNKWHASNNDLISNHNLEEKLTLCLCGRPSWVTGGRDKAQ
jgi:flagella basal body P-ring formation protein FlgA